MDRNEVREILRTLVVRVIEDMEDGNEVRVSELLDESCAALGATGTAIEGWAAECSDGEPDFRVHLPSAIEEEFPGRFRPATLILHPVQEEAR